MNAPTFSPSAARIACASDAAHQAGGLAELLRRQLEVAGEPGLLSIAIRLSQLAEAQHALLSDKHAEETEIVLLVRGRASTAEEQAEVGHV